MTRRLAAVSVLIAFAATPALATAGTTAWGVAVRRAIVNRDHSVTIEWGVESADVSITSVAVDQQIVKSWFYRSQERTFTTTPLRAGWHTITVGALETFWSNVYLGSSCETSAARAYWLCRRSWRHAVYVNVPSGAKPLCIVPTVLGLQFEDAKARIKVARCSMGPLRRVRSDRPAGTVLIQRPKAKERRANGAAISLVVSTGPAPTK